jgi:YafQ family addiction module toxin component
MRDFYVEDKLERILQKLRKKDKNTYDILLKKIQEIASCMDVNHYKNLRKPLQHLKRVHIRGPFVLIFKYEESEDTITFYNFDHHDYIYLQ